jgi:hypothetical protein
VATLADLKAAVDQLLNLAQTGKLLRLNSNTRERAFEAFVFALCARAVASVGGTASLSGIKSGSNPSQIVFRGSPGQMWSRLQDFCYLDCRLNTKAFEIHLDVTYEGMSGANHEIDVSIVDAAHAEQVRTLRIMPRTNKNLIGALECKFYDSTPGVALARTFVGLLRDCSSRRFDAFVANQTTDGIDKYLSKKWAPKAFVDLTPGDASAEQRLVSYLGQELRQWSHSR